VFYGATTRAELVCWGELGSLVGTLLDGRLYGALVKPEGDWNGATGFVTDALLPRMDAVADSDVYLAGPPPMVNAVLALLRERGVQLDRIHYDSFG